MNIHNKKYNNNNNERIISRNILTHHIHITIQVTVEGGVRILGMAPNNRMRFLSWDIMRPHVMSIRLSLPDTTL